MSDGDGATRPRRRRAARATPKPRSPTAPKVGPKVEEEQVELATGRGRKGKGDGPEGEYWDVLVDGKRAGEVFVNMVDLPPLGPHASLQIFLNKPDQGKGIGRIAYRLAAEASRHDSIFLHMRKGNTASRRAAEAAGFADASPEGITQLILKRDRRTA